MYEVEFWCPDCGARVIGVYQSEKEGIGYFVCDACGAKSKVWIGFRMVRQAFVDSDPELVK